MKYRALLENRAGMRCSNKQTGGGFEPYHVRAAPLARPARSDRWNPSRQGWIKHQIMIA